MNKTVSEILWLLVPGHGGMIAGEYQMKGNRSPVWSDNSQFFEGEFSRAIVARLMELMTAAGIPYVNIVPEHVNVSLRERVRRANEIYSKENIDGRECILLSIHSNSGGGSGYEVFTSKGETQSDLVATIFFNKFGSAFPLAKMRTCVIDGDVDKEADFTVLTDTHMPAVLTESFFYDNEEECKSILMTKKGRDRIASAHFDAILDIEKHRIRRV